MKSSVIIKLFLLCIDKCMYFIESPLGFQSSKSFVQQWREKFSENSLTEEEISSEIKKNEPK